MCLCQVWCKKLQSAWARGECWIWDETRGGVVNLLSSRAATLLFYLVKWIRTLQSDRGMALARSLGCPVAQSPAVLCNSSRAGNRLHGNTLHGANFFHIILAPICLFFIWFLPSCIYFPRRPQNDLNPLYLYNTLPPAPKAPVPFLYQFQKLKNMIGSQWQLFTWGQPSA